jgi:hypothetical protein
VNHASLETVTVHKRTGDGMMRTVLIWQYISFAKVHINPKNSRPKIFIDELTVSIRVVPTAFVTRADVKVTIRPKMNVSAIMIVSLVIHRQQREFCVALGKIRVGGGSFEAGHSLMKAVGENGPRGWIRTGGVQGIKNIEKAIFRKSRMKGQTKKAAFSFAKYF